MAFTLLCSADYNQGAECFSAQARGRQCVPTCLMFSLTATYIKPCASIETSDLNEILFAGSHLYSAICHCDTGSGLIDPQNMPERISYKGRSFYVNHKRVLSGFMEDHMLVDSETYHSLEAALLIITEPGYGLSSIIVFKGVSVGIHMHGSLFYIFDSHSRNQHGMSCPDGKCVLGELKSVQEVATYLRALSSSVSFIDNHITQFDLHAFKFSIKYRYTPFSVHILDNERGFKIENIRRRKCHPEKSSELHDLLKKQRLIDFVDDRNVTGSTESLQASISSSICCDSEDVSQISHQTESLISHFDELVSAGPDYVCSCCTQTFFRHYMRNVENLSEKNRTSLNRFLTSRRSVHNIEWVCQLCFDSARLGKVPKFWVKNGLQFPENPKELQLSNLEERLVSPRLPFMQLREMPRGGQVNLKGNIVNVPADVNGTIKSLPRMIDENETIMLKLKRKLSYKHHVAFENIRPNKVFDAAKWLVANSALFRNEGITLNETWLQLPPEMTMISEQEVSEINEVSSSNNGSNVDQSESDDGWTEDNFINRPTGNLDTYLQSVDFREFNQILSVAPGEKNSPIGLFQDYHSEVLSFPTIFCGQPRTENTARLVPLHYSEICKWELRNIDRRVALSVPNIFFKLKRLQIKQIKDKVSLAIRKCKTKGIHITAGELLTPGFVDKLTMQNDGYRVLRTLRGSPPYWRAAKRDVFAMIRQLGTPTWFCSFSAAETKWMPLLKSLAKLVHGKDLLPEEIDGMTWQDKCILIKSDPVTCARFFDHRVQIFIKKVMNHPSQPIGEILDFFYRVEFQQRGSPHIHMIIWVNDAPIHGVSSDSSVAAFVCKYTTCHQDDTIPTLINYQTHRHAQTCKKNGNAVCRFCFPIPPMPETVVLHPLGETEEAVSSGDYERVIAFLNDLHKTQTVLQFEDFLAQLEVDYETYVRIIRSSLSRPKVFLKRTVSESRINSYNPVLLKCWKANMDIQYVLDPYSCVSYIVSYISKGQRGLSNLLRDACNEAKELDSDVRQQVRRIGNQFLSSVEIGAQEAVYLTLQMPLRRCTRDIVYVDTKKPDERTSLIKPLSDLKDLPLTSKNIEMDNMLKRYKRRPKVMEQLCYADFASWYELCSGTKSCKLVDPINQNELPETEYEQDQDDNILDYNKNDNGNVVRFPCGTRVRRRKKQKVIYSYVTSMNHDREEHFREKIMLYTHWRNEELDLIQGFDSYEQSFNAKEEEINANKFVYEKRDDNFYASMLENIDSEVECSAVNPQAQHEDLIDADEGPSQSDAFGCFDPRMRSAVDEDYDLGEDLGISRTRVCTGNLPSTEMDNEQYLRCVRELNVEQKSFFYHILHKVKIQSLPFYTFLSGGAGCGKSVVVRALNQALLKYFNHLREEDPNTLKLLLCAPTGKAAHNIGGSTIHSAFCIPANQSFKFKPLDMQQLNTMRALYRDLKVVIIDEISMVGRGMFNFINLRLQEIKGCTKSFGNVSILAVGDLYQLKPVLDSWVFSQVYNSVQLQSMCTSLWVELFDFFELTEVMRQKDDREFALLLNRLREGEHTEEDLSILEKRHVKELEAGGEIIKHMPHLYCTRADVRSHNETVLSEIPSSDKIEIDAIDTVSGNVNSSLHTKILSRIPLDSNKTMGLQKCLQLGLGMPAELCSNIDTTDGLTNGAPCCIKKFDYRVENSSRCSIVWVEFADQSTGKGWRTKYKHLYKDGIPASWTPILEICRRFMYKYHKTYQIIRRQFPLYISAGKTIHKAQGSTIKKAVLHFGSRSINHVHYVGLSRVTSLSGVHILSLNSAKISVSPDVQLEMDRLRTQRQILFPETRTISDNVIRVCFQNCRSLRKHIEDVKHEHILLSADIIGFVETRCSGMTAGLEIDGFRMLSSEKDQSAHGIAIYYRQDLDLKFLIFKTMSSIEYALLSVSEDVVITFIYCPPKVATVQNFTALMTSIANEILDQFTQNELTARLILVGDFNFEYKEDRCLAQVFKNRLNLQQFIDCVTTDYGSSLDHVYTDLPSDRLTRCGVLESYYSDHKALYIEFRKYP